MTSFLLGHDTPIISTVHIPYTICSSYPNRLRTQSALTPSHDPTIPMEIGERDRKSVEASRKLVRMHQRSDAFQVGRRRCVPPSIPSTFSSPLACFLPPPLFHRPPLHFHRDRTSASPLVTGCTCGCTDGKVATTTYPTTARPGPERVGKGTSVPYVSIARVLPFILSALLSYRPRGEGCRRRITTTTILPLRFVYPNSM